MSSFYSSVRAASCLFAAVLAGLLASTASADVFNMPAGQTSLLTVPIDNPGNAADTRVMNDGTSGYGQVNYSYNIGKYDVTIGQYTAFLNAVAATDPNSLWDSYMAIGNLLPYNATSGINRSGSSGSYTYTATNPDFPIMGASFWDACRFTNWLHNGQPANVTETVGTTETGAYDLTNATAVTNNTVTRTPGATWVVASENEWYKAAYYDPSLNGGSGGYWLYPTRSNTAPGNSLALAATTPNEANYYINGYADHTNYLTPVGTFAASPSAYGTFDQGGDVWQWNDTIIGGSGRGFRGGSCSNSALNLQAGYHSHGYPANQYGSVGFRVAQVPEPASLGLLSLGTAALFRRRRSPKE